MELYPNDIGARPPRNLAIFAKLPRGEGDSSREEMPSKEGEEDFV